MVATGSGGTSLWTSTLNTGREGQSGGVSGVLLSLCHESSLPNDLNDDLEEANEADEPELE
jgi:hypothetical protein